MPVAASVQFSYLIYRFTHQDVHITLLVTDNKTKELKRERKKWDERMAAGD